MNKRIKIVEATLDQAVKADAQKAANEIDNADVEVYSGKGDIEEALDDALKTNKRQVKKGNHEFVNVLLVGGAGTGKTARVHAWAKKNGIALLGKDAKTLDPTDMGGAIHPDKEGTAVQRLATTEFDELERPNSVLFLDEYNRAPSDVRGSLLTLVNDHEIPDARVEGGMRFFKNFLFTIAAINPPNPNYNTDTLDAAERSRFYNVNVVADKKVTQEYLKDKYQKELAEEDDPEEKQEIEGRMRIADALLGSSQFKFDGQQEEDEANEMNLPILNPRTFAKLLEYSDGTKKDFLRKWDGLCNVNKKGMAERILANYQDVDNKANSVFKNKDGEEVKSAFDKPMSAWDKVAGKLDGLGI